MFFIFLFLRRSFEKHLSGVMCAVGVLSALSCTLAPVDIRWQCQL